MNNTSRDINIDDWLNNKQLYKTHPEPNTNFSFVKIIFIFIVITLIINIIIYIITNYYKININNLYDNIIDNLFIINDNLNEDKPEDKLDDTNIKPDYEQILMNPPSYKNYYSIIDDSKKITTEQSIVENKKYIDYDTTINTTESDNNTTINTTESDNDENIFNKIKNILFNMIYRDNTNFTNNDISINTNNNIDPLDKAITNVIKQNNEDIDFDESSSSIQSRVNLKSGWCYVGKDRGVRSCAKVDKDNTCMSGDIFPTKDICINPNLRL